MAWLETLYLNPFVLFTFVLARVSGIVTTAPIFTGDHIPVRVRAMLAVSLALLLTPLQWGKPIAQLENLPDYAILMAGELLIGVVLGLGVMILMSGLQLAGQVIAQMSGMALADVLSPGTDAEVPLFSNMLYMVAMAVFVVIGGHRVLLDALLHTFVSLPIGHGPATESLGQLVVTLMSASFALGIRAAAPAMVALLLATLVLGLVGRTLPQLNILVLGFGVNSLVTMGALIVSIGAIAWLFQDYFEPTLQAAISALTASVAPSLSSSP